MNTAKPKLGTVRIQERQQSNSFFFVPKKLEKKKNPIFLQNNAGIATEWRFTWLIEAAQQDFTGDN